MGKDAREKIAKIIVDYRAGEISAPDAAHVDRWANQLPATVQEPVLKELAHILKISYASKEKVKSFLGLVSSSKKLVGDDPKVFWKGVSFLRLQQAGNSQRDMLSLFDKILQDTFGIITRDCGANPSAYVYLDDGVFSGGRVKSDMVRWIETAAPKKAKVHVVVMALHRYGHYAANGAIEKAAAAAGKAIEVTWWRAMEFEDRRAYTDNSDVLRVKSIPEEAAPYIAGLEYKPVLRQQNNLGPLGLFSSAEARNLIEQEFLKGGILVRRRCTALPPQMRPLGSTWLQTPGFGTMFVTYRNIANNAPLVLWAGNPWYPLFPRITN